MTTATSSSSSAFRSAVKDRLAAVAENESSSSSDAETAPKSGTDTDLTAVKELILDGKTLPKELSAEDKEYLAKFTALEKLTCNQTGLQHLSNFPAMACLKTLEVADNHLPAEELRHLSTICPTVKRLVLGGSKLKTVQDLDPLKDLKNLQHLNLELTPLADGAANYRDSVFEQMPSLVTLDGKNRQNKDVDDSEGDDEDDEDEDYEEEEEEAGEAGEDTTLKDFYTKAYVEGEDEEDDDEAEFAPEGDDDDDDISEDDDDDDDEDAEEDEEEEETEGEGGEKQDGSAAQLSPSAGKRKLEPSIANGSSAGEDKKAKADA